MKKLLTHLFLGATMIAASFQAQAQYCGMSEVSNCGVPTTYAQNNPGFPPLDSIPCFVQGVAANNVIQFTNYTNFSVGPQNVHVYKLQIDSIENLPCGICWSTNKANNMFSTAEFGCFQFQGTTNDPAGQSKCRVFIGVNISDTSSDPGSFVTQYSDAGGIFLYVRVSNGTVCAGVDTSSNGQRLQATCETAPLGVNQIVQTLRNLTIQPNPMTGGESRISFTSDNGGDQQIRITNLIGGEVYNTTYTAKVGLNETTISRSGMAAGVYILSVGNSQGTATRKFVITD